jgi:hypothetical protein
LHGKSFDRNRIVFEGLSFREGGTIRSYSGQKQILNKTIPYESSLVGEYICIFIFHIGREIFFFDQKDPWGLLLGKLKFVFSIFIDLTIEYDRGLGPHHTGHKNLKNDLLLFLNS